MGRKISFIVKKIYGYNASWIYLVGLSEVISLFIIFANIYSPQYIFKYLFEEPLYDRAFMVMVSYGACLLLSHFIKNNVDLVIAKVEENICNSYTVEMSELKTSCMYMYLEDDKVMNLVNELKEYDMSVFLGTMHKAANAIAQLVTIVGITAIMSRLNIAVVLLLLLIFIANYVVTDKMNHEGYKYMTEVQPTERKEQYCLNLMADFSYGKDLRVYNMFPFIRDKYSVIAKKMSGCYQRIFFSNLKANIFENMTNVIQIIGVYIFLAWEVMRKGLGIGEFTLYFNAVNQFSASINILLKSYLSLTKMGLYVDDLIKFMALPHMDSVGGNEDFVKGKKFCFEFSHVSFRYPGSEAYVLKDVNLQINSGERLAVVGTNGAGKTTLIKLLLRLYIPTEGKILLNGRDINCFKYEEYAKVFSVVFQDFKLFAFSIDENICFKKAYNGQKLKSALEESGLADKIDRLPLGKETPLFKVYDDAGIELSGGEGQKLGIARALYKDSPVIILDEPTSALDPVAEYEIYQRFGGLVKGKTSIYISHRLASVRFADNIIVLDKGVIVEKGAHDVLIENNGLYSTMYHMQADYYTDVKEGSSGES